jgi:acetyltransferase-like isoleucine patch superfamily enzyme
MGVKLKEKVSAIQLSGQLGLKATGADVFIEEICSYDDATSKSLCFAREVSDSFEVPDVVVISPQDSVAIRGVKIESSNPRLSFARALNILKESPGFVTSDEPANVPVDASVAPSAILGKGVKIGNRTVIGHNVVIYDEVSIGNDCYIKSNSVIGEDGFGFERDEEGVPIRIQHLGSVIIGNGVEIGSLNTVCRGTLGNTIIEDGVKTDDHVHIAHNCKLGRNSLVTACAEFSGGVVLGQQCWVGPNSSIKQKVTIGDNAFIGIASSVTKNVGEGVTVAGNPARPLRSIS